MHKIQWGIALFSNNIHLRGESLNILFLELIIYYSEDSWNNTRFCRVGVWAPTCEVQDAVQAALFSNNIVLRGRKEDMLFSAFIINYINEKITWYQFSNYHISKRVSDLYRLKHILDNKELWDKSCKIRSECWVLPSRRFVPYYKQNASRKGFIKTTLSS